MSIDIAAQRAQFRQAKTELLNQFAESRPTVSSASRLLGHLAKLVDRTLHDLWTAHALPKGSALVAVGGYGRGELFPYSDIDVLILVPQSLADSGDDTAIAAVESFISACWDIGLEIGSSVRTVLECGQEAAGDVTVQTSLLEARFLCGAKARFFELQRVTAQKMDAQDFLTAKLLEMRQRHTKYEDTPYSLEPNCKESPGGLRDLQVVLWLARAANLGKTWHELAQKGLLTAFEARQLQRNEGVLKLIRARLHQVAGRREDRLVFDLQTGVAQTFGYTNTRGLRASEVLMRRYYWAAKAVTQLNQILILNIEERVHGSQNAPMRVINERFLDRGGMLEVVSDDLYQRDPHAILDTFLTFQTDNTLKGLSARTLRALYNAREVMNGPFRKDPLNRQTFMDILKAPQGLTRVIRLMNQTSVLGRYLWVFRRIVGQMQHDLFHV
ncbi:MAG: nucleotidyltransferase domain-containing protein, partial [Burkholderiales bacterium]|nr:nucleotidyltransferase domain-containing protein [Burkholderiales bacterium]